jgi:hypothetical protein
MFQGLTSWESQNAHQTPKALLAKRRASVTIGAGVAAATGNGAAARTSASAAAVAGRRSAALPGRAARSLAALTKVARTMLANASGDTAAARCAGAAPRHWVKAVHNTPTPKPDAPNKAAAAVAGPWA